MGSDLSKCRGLNLYVFLFCFFALCSVSSAQLVCQDIFKAPIDIYSGQVYTYLGSHPNPSGNGHIIESEKREFPLPQTASETLEGSMFIFRIAPWPVLRFFHFRQKGMTYETPDVIAYNEAIDFFNKISHFRIPVRYFIPTKAKASPMECLTRFAYFGELPMARFGHMYYHDITYHAAAIYIPIEVFLLAQNQVRLLMEFSHWLALRKFENIDKQLVLVEETLKAVGKEIDTSNGDFGRGLYGDELMGDQFSQSLQPLIDFGNQGLSPAQFLRNLFDDQSLEFKSLIESFLISMTTLNPIFNQGLDWLNTENPDQIRQKIQERMDQIDQTVRQISSR